MALSIYRYALSGYSCMPLHARSCFRPRSLHPRLPPHTSPHFFYCLFCPSVRLARPWRGGRGGRGVRARAGREGEYRIFRINILVRSSLLINDDDSCCERRVARLSKISLLLPRVDFCPSTPSSSSSAVVCSFLSPLCSARLLSRPVLAATAIHWKSSRRHCLLSS